MKSMLPKALLQVEGKKAPAKKPEPLPEDSPVHEPTEDEIAYILAQQDSDQRAIDAILEGNGDIAALKKSTTEWLMKWRRSRRSATNT